MKKFYLPIMVNSMFDENLSASVMYQLQMVERYYGKDGYFAEDLRKAELEPCIRFMINSPGGYVSDLFAIIDFAASISVPYEAYCLGEAASCAAVLFSTAKKGNRYIGKNSHILLHQVSAGAFGQIEDLKIAAKQAEKMNEQIIKILADNTGKSADKIREDLNRDLWLDAEQAVAYGIADKIIDNQSTQVKEMAFLKDSKGRQIFSAGEDIEAKRAKAEQEVKATSFEVKACSEDDENFYFEGYAAVFGNEDSDGDVLVRGAFARSLREFDLLGDTTKRTVLWQHDTDQPIGTAILKEDDHGLYFKASLPKSDTFVRDRVIPQLRHGSVRTMSFGFKTINRYFKDNKRNLTDVEIFEISPVTIPANAKSKIKSGSDKEILLEDIETITDVSRFFKGKGFSNSETNEILFHLKKVLKDNASRNEPAPSQPARNEQVEKLLADIKDLTAKLNQGV